ncbi:MAG: hypothetical protein HY896_07600 [Deltaproteobacteria bacterium]|nr:hypothetical protein [Deltaproteobacteria bacterium]
MIALRRVFIDGAECPELVLLHYAAVAEEFPDRVLARSTLVLPPSAEPGKRESWIFLPSPAPGGRILVRYFFSTVSKGAEWFSQVYETAVPGDDILPDMIALEEKSPGNLLPAAGTGMFRLRLPLREESPRTGLVRFGFGAMRKKPAPDLCRAGYLMSGSVPVVEVPSALSVLKNRPMPYFLYHYHTTGDGGSLAADKINCARITLRDETGEVLCSRLLWGDAAWTAHNLTVMELKNFASAGGKASDNYFAADREEFLRLRSYTIAGFPLPRTFEGYVYGPEGSVVEYCFQVLVRKADGSVAAVWRNRDGGNWTVTL